MSLSPNSAPSCSSAVVNHGEVAPGITIDPLPARTSDFVHGVQALFLAGGPLARPAIDQTAQVAQAQMAQAVAGALEREEVLVVEAGTGVGKTWAYLAPLLLGGRKAWLSTATQALQDQLIQRDIPDLSKALGLPVHAVVLKGRGSYACLQRLEMARTGELRAGPSDPAWAAALERVHRWASQSLEGDLAELGDLDDRSPLRPWISSTRDNCLGDACPRLAHCHVLRARRRAQEAEWVVINHHLFLASQDRLGDDSPSLLPPPEVVVFDEAHRLVTLGETLLGHSVGADELRELAREMQSQGPLWAKGLQPWAHRALMLEQAARALHQLAVACGITASQSPWDANAPQGMACAQWHEVRRAIRQALGDASAALQSVAGAAAPMERLAGRAQALAMAWQALAGDAKSVEGASDGTVRWIDWGGDGGWRLMMSAPDPAIAFQRCMGSVVAPRSWVFTSATLGVDAGLTWLTDSLGLNRRADLRTLRIPSPFDHAAQASLYIPDDLPEPAHEQHSLALAHAVAEWAAILGGRTLVLTTSLRASARIAAALREQVAQTGALDLQVLAQGQGSKRALLARFRAAAQGGLGAVMIASASFWEGVDLAGDVLQLLVIDKLPFPSPGEPLTQARSWRARSLGLNAFQSCYLPVAALALKQGAGRLIRSGSDRGVLVVADRRLLTQSYGSDLLAALPQMTRLMDPHQMREALLELVRQR